MNETRPDSIFQIGDLLNNTYRIESVLGRGGTSEVYKARSEISGQPVALKALRSEFSRNEDFLVLLNREEAIREVRHDAIVRYFHNQRTDSGVVFLVMDHVEGVGLDRKLKDGGMSAEDLMTVAARVTEGLQAAHSKNITHRDLSPDNIILRGGDPADPVIIDFGIAKDSNPGAETIVGNEFAGKYAYAAPEQLNGQTDPRSDIYSLGALLLATFRGRAPDIGNNPMEVIERKSRPLDTEGVPERLKTVIDRMTVPDRDQRVQDAASLLALIRDPSGASTPSSFPPEFDPEATVVASTIPPRAPSADPLDDILGGPSVPPATPVTARTAPASPKPERTDSERKGKGGLIAALVVVLAVAGGAGAYFSGLIGGNRLPLVDPFTLSITRGQDGVFQAEGHVPSQLIADALAGDIANLGGTSDLILARGPIDIEWGKGVTDLLDMVLPLRELQISVANDDARVTGYTENRGLYDQLALALNEPGLVPGLSVEGELELGPRILDPSRVDSVIDSLANCGELSQFNPPQLGYDQNATVVVVGRVAMPETRSALETQIASIAGTRDVIVDTEVLNPALCTIDAVLPEAPAGGFDIGFSQGTTGEANPSGKFIVGDNPVIDVTIPADITDGYLLVTVLDVSGNVFHLLPNINRPDNSVATLRQGQSGSATVRVAYSIDDSIAANGSKIAFSVDDSTLGKTKVMVIHSDTPVIAEIRPTTESAAGFAEALLNRTAPVRSLDSRILTTELR